MKKIIFLSLLGIMFMPGVIVFANSSTDELAFWGSQRNHEKKHEHMKEMTEEEDMKEMTEEEDMDEMMEEEDMDEMMEEEMEDESDQEEPGRPY